ncbi:hypothetical protein [Holdemanella porci]|uniref:hypothetical protein n=1 Tax=Holdemanella porci TaxID=2652276 RepID=UPI003F8EE435
MQILINQFSPDREINLTHLNELIEQAEKKVELKEYITTNSWDIMQNALEGAKIVQNNPINQKAVDDACGLLENGLKGLKADKSKLEQRLKDAKAYDGKEEFYTADSWESFSDALKLAKSESTDEKSTPETVKKAYEDLDKAITGLTYKEVDKTNLNKLIEKAKAYDGKQEFYTEDSWNTFAEALNVAKSESTNENSTPETVKKAYDRLNKAIKGLTYKEVDKTNLNKLIEKAKAYDGKQEFYTEDSWKSFSDALAAAKSEYKSENSTPETVKDAQEKLDAAIKGLTYMNVDKAQLQTLIETARGKAEEDYTTESWNVFAEALGNAEDELNSENSTPETVKDAQEKLDAAIKDLAPKKQVDKSKLEALIAEATGKVESQYTPESWTAFTTALGTANEVNGNKDATQETVDQACVNLRAGIDRLTAKADKTQLQALIDEASNKNNDEYTEESWASFETALNDAKGVSTNENASQDVVDKACESLSKAIEELKFNKSQLKVVIDQVENKNSEDYTEESWETFANALAEARSVFEDENATPESVDQAYRKLNEAINGLTVKVNKPELKELIDQVQDKKSEDYTDASWDAFETALEEAKAVFENEAATSEQISQAYRKLDEAIKGLAVKADKSELTTVIVSSVTLNESDYTPESWKQFKEALDYADEVSANPNVSQEEVDEAKDKLEKPSKNNGTNTGTSIHVGIFASTALASATAVLGLFGYKRRNKKK